ncbi:MAG TPA: PEP-CTERM sorting domain-containing protein, partial [Bryobacteraceae bacterium]
PNAPFTFKFNSFTPNSNATLGQTFLTVFGSSFAQELSPIATSVVMPAGSLLPGTTYTYELDFSDRITGTDPINGVPALVAFDVRTDGTFTPAAAAVPEPSTLIPLAIVILGVMAQRRRRGDKTTTSCR